MTGNSGSKPITRICPVCGHDQSNQWLIPPKSPGPVVRCRKCGFAFVNPIISDKALIDSGPVLNGRPARLLTSTSLDDIRGSWEEPIINNYLRDFSTKKRDAEDSLSQLNDLITNPGSILDVGCFCGVFLSVAAQQGWQAFGLEPLVIPAIYARGRFGLPVITDTLKANLYPPNFFDVVSMFQVFEHMINPRVELFHMKTILKAGGLVVIEVPNIDTFPVKVLGANHRHFVQDHISFFSAKTLSLLLESMGFRIRRVWYPTRQMSLGKILWWIAKDHQRWYEALIRILPDRLLSKVIGVNFQEILTVIAEKPATGGNRG